MKKTLHFFLWFFSFLMIFIGLLVISTGITAMPKNFTRVAKSIAMEAVDEDEYETVFYGFFLSPISGLLEIDEENAMDFYENYGAEKGFEMIIESLADFVYAQSIYDLTVTGENLSALLTPAPVVVWGRSTVEKTADFSAAVADVKVALEMLAITEDFDSFKSTAQEIFNRYSEELKLALAAADGDLQTLRTTYSSEVLSIQNYAYTCGANDVLAEHQAELIAFIFSLQVQGYALSTEDVETTTTVRTREIFQADSLFGGNGLAEGTSEYFNKPRYKNLSLKSFILLRMIFGGFLIVMALLYGFLSKEKPFFASGAVLTNGILFTLISVGGILGLLLYVNPEVSFPYPISILTGFFVSAIAGVVGGTVLLIFRKKARE